MRTAVATGRRQVRIRNFTAMAATLFLGVASLALTPAASAAEPVTWYVNGATGSASYDCLAATPGSDNAGPCLTIGDALAKASDGDSISIAATDVDHPYAERLMLTERVDLLGDSAGGVVITGDGTSGPLITIGTTGTTGDPLTIADLTVTGALGTGNTGSGILVQSSTTDQTDLVFDTVTSTHNGGNGIAFNTASGYGIGQVSIADSAISENGGAGIRVASATVTVNGFSVTGSTIAQNKGAGFSLNPNATAQTVTGLAFTNDTFTANSAGGDANTHDVSIMGFSGDLAMTDVTVNAANGASPHVSHGVVISGRGTTPRPVAGAISLTDVTVTGTVGKAALYIYNYRDVSAITMSGVDLSATTAPKGQLIADHTGSTPLDIGDATIKTIAIWNTGGVDATDAVFKTGATAPFTTLDRAVAADVYQIADQVADGVDYSGAGMVRFMTNKVVTTPNSSVNPGVVLAHLKYAQDLATVTDTVMAQPGTYYEGIVESPGTQVTGPLALADNTVANPVFVLSGALSGNGTITGPLGIGRDADLAPGASPGVIASGDYTQAGDYLVDVVSGTAAGYPVAGTDYDQLVVTGTVTLQATAQLKVTFSGDPLTAPAEFVIIKNDGVDAVVGTFADLPEGSVITSGGQPLALSYSGGSGNDVTLRLMAQNELVLSANTTQMYGTTQTLSATGGSGSATITYAVTAGDTLCTLDPVTHELSLTSGTGTCTVTATRPASGAYLETSDSVTITAQRRSITVTADDPTPLMYGADPPAAYTYQVSGDGFVTGEGFATGPTCTSPYRAGDPAGTYLVQCVATAAATKYDVTTVNGHLMVAPAPLLSETAVLYTGSNAYQTKSTTSTSVTVPLEAQVDISEVAGAAAVHDALVTFTDGDTGKVLAKDVPVAVDGSDDVGVAVAWVTLGSGPYGLGTYTIEVTVTNSFTGDNSDQPQMDKEVAVALPATTAGTVSGLAITVPATLEGITINPAGSLKTGGYTGTYLNFFFQAGSTTKKATSPKGQLTASWLGDNGWTYHLKSNAVTTVGFNTAHTEATIAFKASLWRTNGEVVEPIDGNVVGKLQATEGSNLIGLTAQSSKTSALYLSTNWVKVNKTYSTVPVPADKTVGFPVVVN